MDKNKPILLRHTAEFKFEKVEDKDGKEEVIISGNAMPLGAMSRNKVKYRDKSVKKNYKTLEGVAFLNGHDPTQSLGHVQEVGINETHITYKANVDPEEKNYIRKVERKDIRHVSVGCMVDKVEFMEDGSVECDVVEFVELSAVTVAGFQNTSAEKEGLHNLTILTEAFGNEEQIEKLKGKYKDKDKEKEADDKDKDDDEEADDDDKDKEKEADDEDDDDKEKEGDDSDDKDKEKEGDDEDDDEEETDDDDEDDSEEDTDPKNPDKKEQEGEEETIEEKVSKLITRQEELFSKFDEVINRLSIIESNVDALNDSEEDTETEEPGKEEDLTPNTEEKFEDNKNHAPKTKEETKAKEKALFGENSKKLNGEQDSVDMNQVRMDNLSY